MKHRKNITVILPCAGSGVRMGIWFTKELFPINSTQTVIDIIIEEIIASNVVDTIVFIINDKRGVLVDYLHKYKNDINIIYIYQTHKDKEFSDMISAVKDAKNLLSEYNLLMFPDTIVQGLKDSLIQLNSELNRNNTDDYIFIARKENRVNELKDEGILLIKDGKATYIADKQKYGINDFNAIWVGIGFNNLKFDDLLHILKEVITYKKIKKIYGKIVFCENSVDLGDWRRVREYYGRKKT